MLRKLQIYVTLLGSTYNRIGECRMPRVNGEELKKALVQTQESLEAIRALTEEFIRHRIREYGRNVAADEDAVTMAVEASLARRKIRTIAARSRRIPAARR